ncbi:hypothetical protein FOZ62_011589, partial [Perkinsus olseni]
DGWWCPSKGGISDAETCECTDDFSARSRLGKREETYRAHNHVIRMCESRSPDSRRWLEIPQSAGSPIMVFGSAIRRPGHRRPAERIIWLPRDACTMPWAIGSDLALSEFGHVWGFPCEVHITTNPPLLKCPGRQGDYGPGDPVRPQVAGLQDFIEKSEPQLLEKDAMTDDRG